MREIKILGAGPAGLTAAINLAKSGYKIKVFEKNSDVGKRFNGDLQGLENWSEKKDVLEDFREMNVNVNFDCDPFAFTKVTNCKLTKIVHLKKPFYYLIKRGNFKGAFDYGLKEQALNVGADLIFGKTLASNDADIIATGPIFKRVPGVDKSIVFRTNHEDIVIAILNDELAYKGYSYLIVTKGNGCLGTVVLEDLPKVNECYKKTLDYIQKTFDLKMENIKEVGGVGSFMIGPMFRKGKSLYCGEAAGLQDVLWGFGIRMAVTSGYLAAKSITENKDYSEMASNRLLNKMKATIVNRYLWEKLSGNNYKLIIKNFQFIANHLFNLHSFPLWQRLLYKPALNHLKKKYPKCINKLSLQ